MKRIIKKAGDVFEVPLSGGRHGYAQWLPDGTARVFKIATKTLLNVEQAIALPVAFRVMVARPSPGRHGWSKVGKAAIPSAYLEPQKYAKKDVLSGALTCYFKGEERPATASELRGLETLAVWGHPHIAERLEAIVEGRNSEFHERIRVV